MKMMKREKSHVKSDMSIIPLLLLPIEPFFLKSIEEKIIVYGLVHACVCVIVFVHFVTVLFFFSSQQPNLHVSLPLQKRLRHASLDNVVFQPQL